MGSLSFEHEAAIICFSTISAANHNFYKESFVKWIQIVIPLQQKI